ncbi:MAG TPA: flavin-dependent monooxygenase [Candidatus Binataceae bacterium]|nr:flavin-dependent monooxygenase [Candidatus Binataceae bacterium]
MRQTTTGDQGELAKSLLASARDMIPVLAERAAQAEKQRFLPAETIADFKRANFFRAIQPKRYGGYELDPQVFFDLQMTIAQGCMSSGWIYGVVGVHNWQLGLFDPQAQEDVWGKDSSVLIASSYMPRGQVERVDGGFRFSGRWSFSSGCDHGDWYFLGGIVPAANGAGPPDYRTFLVPRKDVTINDNWHTWGLKGTGSKEVVIESAFVPEHRTHRAIDGFTGMSPGLAINTSPLYKIPFGQIFVRAVSTASIGALEGALNVFRKYGSTRVSTNDMSRTAEDPSAGLAAAEAAVAIDDMKLELHRNFASMMATLGRGEALDVNDRIHWRYQSAAVAQRCCDHIDRLFHACGGQGVYTDHPIGRFMNDIHAARLHYANNADKFARNYGGVLLGLGNSDFFI